MGWTNALPEGVGKLLVMVVVFGVCFGMVRLLLPFFYERLASVFVKQVSDVGIQLDHDFIKVDPKRLRLYFSLYYVFWAVVGFAIGFPSYVLSIVFSALLVLVARPLPGLLVRLNHQRRVSRLGLQLVDGLTLMSNGLRSGLNISQTIDLVSREMPSPLSQEFRLVLSETQLGTTVEAAFDNLAKRIPTEDVEMLATAVMILKETGGNLAETFDTITYTIRERIKIKNKISALVTQGIIQGMIIMAMPFGIAIMLYLVDPNQILPMFTTPVGWVMIAMMLTLQIVGGLAIWKIIDIKV